MTLPLLSPDDLPEPPSPAQAAQSMAAGKPRLRVPVRDQIEMRWESLDYLLETDHPARIVWAAVFPKRDPRAAILRLFDCDFIERHGFAALIGPTGTGKRRQLSDERQRFRSYPDPPSA